MRIAPFIFLVLLFSCKEERYYRTKTGLLYQVIKTNKSLPIITMGQTAKVRITQKVGDSLIETNRDGMPLYYNVIPGMSAYNPLEAFDYGLRNGDSVVVIQSVDSMLRKKIFEKMPPWMKPSDEWITTMKIEAVFSSDSALQVDKAKEAAVLITAQKKAGMERIARWLQASGITAQRDSNCFYRLTRAAGSPVDTGRTILLDFTLRTLSGKVLNSTTDTSFHGHGPAQLQLGHHQLPACVESILSGLPVGSKASFYLPGVEIFGVNPPPPAKISDDLILECHLPGVKK